jgi:hypothetical protein
MRTVLAESNCRIQTGAVEYIVDERGSGIMSSLCVRADGGFGRK